MLARRNTKEVLDDMRQRLLLAMVYGIAALLIGNWAIYLETLNEASSRPNPFAFYWLAFSAFVFAAATVLRLTKPRLGLFAGTAACVISCPLVVVAMIRFSGQIIPHDQYEFAVESSIVVIAVATVWSGLTLVGQLRSRVSA
jgi:hypothetical protein